MLHMSMDDDGSLATFGVNSGRNSIAIGTDNSLWSELPVSVIKVSK